VKLKPIVERLTDQLNADHYPIIAGAVELAAAVKGVSGYSGRCLFVVPAGTKVDENDQSSGLNQTKTETFVVFIKIPAAQQSKEKLGFVAFDTLNAIEQNLTNALLDPEWRPDGASSQVTWTEANNEEFNTAELWHSYTYSVDYPVTVTTDPATRDQLWLINTTVSVGDENTDDFEINAEFPADT
jgi:hypothetical protein